DDIALRPGLEKRHRSAVRQCRPGVVSDDAVDVEARALLEPFDCGFRVRTEVSVEGDAEIGSSAQGPLGAAHGRSLISSSDQGLSWIRHLFLLVRRYDGSSLATIIDQPTIDRDREQECDEPQSRCPRDRPRRHTSVAPAGTHRSLAQTQNGPGESVPPGPIPSSRGRARTVGPGIVTDQTGHWSPFELGATASEQNRCCTAENEQAPGRQTGELGTGARHRVTTGAPGLARVRAASGFASGDDELPVHADVLAVRLDLVGPYVGLRVVGEAVDLHSGRPLIIAAGRLLVELRVEVLGPDLE